MLGETAQEISFLLRACTRGAPVGYLCHTATRCTTSVFNPSPSNYEFRVETSNGAGSVGVGSTSGTPGTSLRACQARVAPPPPWPQLTRAWWNTGNWFVSVGVSAGNYSTALFQLIVAGGVGLPSFAKPEVEVRRRRDGWESVRQRSVVTILGLQVSLRGETVLLSWAEPELTVNDRVSGCLCGV